MIWFNKSWKTNCIEFLKFDITYWKWESKSNTLDISLYLFGFGIDIIWLIGE